MAQKYISVILAEKILDMLNESGASEIEKLAALDIAKNIMPCLSGSIIFPRLLKERGESE